jgi:hypothetical protein
MDHNTNSSGKLLTHHSADLPFLLPYPLFKLRSRDYFIFASKAIE